MSDRVDLLGQLSRNVATSLHVTANKSSKPNDKKSLVINKYHMATFSSCAPISTTICFYSPFHSAHGLPPLGLVRFMNRNNSFKVRETSWLSLKENVHTINDSIVYSVILYYTILYYPIHSHTFFSNLNSTITELVCMSLNTFIWFLYFTWILLL